jgi:AraC-like DNA-binding protein
MVLSRSHLRVLGSARRKDEQVERAIGAMKAAPTRRWTVATLGRVAGLSRAAFARRFARATGAAPLHWLTKHRMELARARLLEDSEPLAAIAAEVGYACEFAFAKAFKRVVGIAPGVLRRVARGLPASPSRFRAAA